MFLLTQMKLLVVAAASLSLYSLFNITFRESRMDKQIVQGAYNNDVTVQIYTTSYCPYCRMAKQFFDEQAVKYYEIDVTDNQELRAELTQKANGMKTVPQIFINGKHVGGYSDMMELYKNNKLIAFFKDPL